MLDEPMPRRPVLQVRVRGAMPLDLNRLLRMSKNQRAATKRRRKHQEDERIVMRSQNRLPAKPLEGPLHVRYCRIHEPRKAVDIDNAASGLKTILDGLVDEGVLRHDGPSQLAEIDRVWQATTRDPREAGFFLELVPPPSNADPRAINVAASLLRMAEKALEAPDERTMRADLLAACQAARSAGLDPDRLQH